VEETRNVVMEVRNHGESENRAKVSLERSGTGTVRPERSTAEILSVDGRGE